jgi:hypothetical protein
MRLLPIAFYLMAAGICSAQPPAALPPEPVGPPRGENWQNYNFTSWFETGYRFESQSGNQDQYRSMVNYGNGVRLLGSSVDINSKDGHGRYFDRLSLTTLGLGGDPYQSATLSIGKNRLYQYDLLWRQNAYVNPGLVTGGATPLHPLNTTYGMQDHDLTILPQSKIRFLLSYSHNSELGPGISTITSPGSSDSLYFPIVEDIHWVTNEYSGGVEVHLHGFLLNAVHGWQDFKDDTALGPVAAPASALTSVRAVMPNHGTSPFWRVFTLYNRSIFNMNGRFTYTAGRRAYAVQENAAVATGFTVGNRQVLSFGDAQRPVATGNLTLSVTPVSKVRFTNQTSVYNTRTEGSNAYFELDGTQTFTPASSSTPGAAQVTQFAYFEYLGIRTIANRSEASFQAKWLSLYGGYEYSERRIRSIRQISFGGPLAGDPFDQTNHDRAGFAGMSLTGIHGLNVSLNAEVGRADAPFTPKSDRDYHTVAARIQYHLKALTISASSTEDYNNNATSLTAFSSHARAYSVTAAWAANGHISVDASYSKLYLRTLGGIAYFAAGQQFAGDQSYYLSNIHSGTLGIRAKLAKRVSAFGGYSVVQDTGDGRATPAGPGIAAALAPFQAAQTFPLRFQSPYARISVQLAERLRVNFSYQHYDYRETYFAAQGFRAETGYASLQWSF